MTKKLPWNLNVQLTGKNMVATLDGLAIYIV